MKCNCKEDHGWTTVACCNECRFPMPTEPWDIPFWDKNAKYPYESLAELEELEEDLVVKMAAALKMKSIEGQTEDEDFKWRALVIVYKQGLRFLHQTMSER